MFREFFFLASFFHLLLLFFGVLFLHNLQILFDYGRREEFLKFSFFSPFFLLFIFFLFLLLFVFFLSFFFKSLSLLESLFLFLLFHSYLAILDLSCIFPFLVACHSFELSSWSLLVEEEEEISLKTLLQNKEN